MRFHVKLWDCEGKEIKIKPGHSLVIGKESMCQVKTHGEEDRIYNEQGEPLQCEWGTNQHVYFPEISQEEEHEKEEHPG